jgi:hypothetical protein
MSDLNGRCHHLHIRRSPRKPNEERWACSDCGVLFIPAMKLKEMMDTYRMGEVKKSVSTSNGVEKV